MKPGGIKMLIGFSPEMEKYLRSIKQWPKQMKKIETVVVRLATQEVYKTILRLLPPGDAYKLYRRSFRVSRLLGTDMYGVHCALPPQKAHKLDTTQTILTIHPKHQRAVGPILPSPATVLEKYSPWTLDTLPFSPDRRVATIVSRRVAKGVVATTARKNMKQEALWRRELAEVGIRNIRKKHGPNEKTFSDARVVPDLAFDAFRLEFGLGGVRAKPHWRPAVRKLVQSGIASISKRKEIIDAFVHHRYPALQRMLRTSFILRASEARNFQTFQEKLGLTTGGPHS